MRCVHGQVPIRTRGGDTERIGNTYEIRPLLLPKSKKENQRSRCSLYYGRRVRVTMSKDDQSRLQARSTRESSRAWFANGRGRESRCPRLVRSRLRRFNICEMI